MTDSHDLEFSPEKVVVATPREIVPPKEAASYYDAGQYTLAYVFHRMTGGGLDWGQPVPFNFEGGATIEFNLPPRDVS